ncbi:hypothetical protein [Veillonella agrestimuris]|uniref:hypothetical protein n=1 Tax=Veillonella agrestimuris TaxID=2941340 RepID=UPI00203C86CF|nr:hypothetical protein [Veillonella agrestimuris]
MYKPSKKTIYIASAFLAVAGIYTYWEDVSFNYNELINPEENRGEARLIDSNGIRYTLLNHGNGKESALYDDDKSVTFHRDSEGNLVWDAGLASLIPNIAAGYYMFHGYSVPNARMDGNAMTYRLMSPLKSYEAQKQSSNGSNLRAVYLGSLLGRQFATDGYNREISQRAYKIGEQKGFGSSGARSGGS